MAVVQENGQGLLLGNGSRFPLRKKLSLPFGLEKWQKKLIPEMFRTRKWQDRIQGVKITLLPWIQGPRARCGLGSSLLVRHYGLRLEYTKT